MADELGITGSSYSKIETGKSTPNLTRLIELAKILNVEVSEFFRDLTIPSVAGDPKVSYGNASKADFDKLYELVLKLHNDMDALKTEVSEMKKPVKGKK